jgi:hypothetical protein
MSCLVIVIIDDLSCNRHVNYIIQICNQRFYLLKQLKQQGLPSDKLNHVLDAIILSRLLYAVQSWSGFLSADNVNCVNAFLRKAYRWQLTSSCKCFNDIIDDLQLKLFRASSQSHHCLHHVFEPMRKNSSSIKPRKRGHPYSLPQLKYERTRCAIVFNSLSKYI